MRQSRRRMCVAFAIAVLAAAFGSGCGGDSGDSSATAGDQPSAASGVEEAKRLVENAKARRFNFPGPGSSPGSTDAIRGKTLWSVIFTQALPFNVYIQTGIDQAAEVLDVNVQKFDAQASIANLNRGMRQAIAAKPAGILSVGGGLNQMLGSLEAAEKAGVPVVDAYGLSQESATPPGNFGHASISYRNSGKLQADYAIADSNGKANVLIFGVSAFAYEVERVEGMTSEFKRLCPGCKYKVVDTDVAKLPEIGTLVRTQLRRDPTIDYLIATFDGQVEFMVPALLSGGYEGKVKIIGADLAAPALKHMANDEFVIADVGPPLTMSGWAAMDLMIRSLNNQPPINEGIPLVMFDKTNLPESTNYSQTDLFGTAYVDAYKKAWSGSS